MPGKSQTLSQANGYTSGAARHRDGKSGPNHAEVQHYMDIARQLRADAFATLIRRAYDKLFQGGTAEHAAPRERTQTHTPHRA